MFIGRKWQLAELVEGLNSVRRGRGKLFLVSGEAGIGKTHLVEQVAAIAERDCFRVLWGRCWEGEEAPAFWPWTQIFRNLIRTSESGSAKSVSANFARLSAGLGGRIGQLSDVPSGLPSGEARFRLFDAIAASLREAAEEQPLVLILEDLHEGDRSSLLLLEFISRQIHDMPLLVVATHREPEADLNAVVKTTLGKVIRSANRIPLSGLNRHEVGQFLAQGFEVFLRDETLSLIQEKTGGNPFFLNELGRDLAAHGPERPVSILQVPQGLRIPIQDRLSLVQPDDRHLLTIASVIGREFTPDLLVAVSGYSKDSVLAALGRLAAHRLVDLAGFGLGPYRFSHALVRETIYEETAAVQRWRLHRDVGEALERLDSTQLEAHLEQLAHHFSRAAALGEIDRAIRYSRQAAQQAASRLGYEEAVGHFLRALEIAVAGGRPAAERFDLLMSLGNAQWWAGQVAQASRTFLSAADTARKMGDSSRLARAALRVGEVGHGGVYMQAWAYDPLRAQLLDESLGALGDQTSELKARVQARLSTALYFSPFDSSARRDELSSAAIESARQLGDESTIAYTLNARHLAMWSPDNINERLQLASEITSLGLRTQDLSSELTGRLWRITDLLETGAAHEASTEIKEYLNAAERSGYPHFIAYALMNRAVESMLQGDFTEAEVFSLRSDELAERLSDVNLRLSHNVQMAVLRALQGRPQEAARHLELASGDLPTEVDKLHLSLLCLAGDSTGAAAALASARRLRGSTPPAFWLQINAGLALLARDAQVADEAIAAYEALQPYERRWLLSGRDAVAPLGPVAYYLGLLADFLGKFEAAAGHFERALTSAQAAGARPYVALIQAAYGRMLASHDGSHGNRARAVELLTEALRLSSELGMKQVQRQMEADNEKPGARGHCEESPSQTAILRREGELWTVGFGGVQVLMKDAKGLHLLKRLLSAPGTEMHVLELASGGAVGTNTSRQVHTSGKWSLDGAAAYSVLDPAAKAAYRSRIEELTSEIQEHEDDHDAERASGARRELQFIVDELAAATGLGGRDRSLATPAERARSSITKSIRSSIRRIQAVHPLLGAHLQSAIRTGYLCSYRPDGNVDWQTK